MSLNSRQIGVDPYAIVTPPGSPPPNVQSLLPAVDPATLLGYRVFVFVTVGQSNAANMSIGYTYTGHRPGRVLQLDCETGRIHPQHSDPLVGATGSGGHWVVNAAERLIDADMCDYVLNVGVAAVGGASVEYFAPGQFGTLKHRLLVAGQRLRDLRLRPSCWNFALGESAIGYPEASFRAPLDAMIAYVRSYGFNEPWILDISTLNADPANGNPRVNEGARLALQHAVNGVDILAGVDTDGFTYPTYRLLEVTAETPFGAKVHLNDAGCEQKAILKAANLIELWPLFPSVFLPRAT